MVLQSSYSSPKVYRLPFTQPIQFCDVNLFLYKVFCPSNAKKGADILAEANVNVIIFSFSVETLPRDIRIPRFEKATSCLPSLLCYFSTSS
jgi:hypothetical protein